MNHKVPEKRTEITSSNTLWLINLLKGIVFLIGWMQHQVKVQREIKVFVRQLAFLELLSHKLFYDEKVSSRTGQF